MKNATDVTKDKRNYKFVESLIKKGYILEETGFLVYVMNREGSYVFCFMPFDKIFKVLIDLRHNPNIVVTMSKTEFNHFIDQMKDIR